MLGFDDYPDIAASCASIVAGETHHAAHPVRTAAGCCRSPRSSATPRRSRSPATTPTVADAATSAPVRPRRAPRRTPSPRRRPDGPAQAGQRLRPALLLLRDPQLPRLLRQPPPQRRRSQEAGGWPTQGVRELFLVSENSTSYGKDLGDLRLLETLLPELAAIDGIERVRVSYLQPAETRPGLIEAIADDAGRRALLRPLLPARQRHGAAPDAPVRRPRELPRPARRRSARSPRWPASAPT